MHGSCIDELRSDAWRVGTYLDTLLDQMSRRDHVDYLGSTGISNRSSTPDNEDSTSSNTLVGLDPVVVVFRSVKYGDRSFKRHGIIWV